MSPNEMTIRCPSCRGVSAVARDMVGVTVACPFCSAEFPAYSEVAVVRTASPPPIVPVVKPLKAKRIVNEEPESIEPTEQPDSGDHSSAVPFLVGLALLPLSLPIIWVLLLATGQWDPLFSLTVPISLGICASSLGIGAALTKDWSTSRKLKSVLAIIFLATATGGGLFFLKKEWAEAVRKRFGADEFNWQDYDAGPFSIKVPPKLRKEKDSEPLLPDWNLYSVRYGNPRQAASDCYRIAHGSVPDKLALLPDRQWFDAAIQQLTTDDTGMPLKTTPIESRGFPGVETTFQKSDGATNLTVRLYRVGQAVILLSVEGPLLPADAKDVQTFFKKLYIKGR